MIDDAIVIYHHKILDKGIRIVVDCPEDYYFVNAEKYSLLNNIFNNVLSNAIKFSPQHGRIEISCDDTADEIFIKIRDYGFGIPFEVVKNIEHDQQSNPARGTLGEHGEGNGLIITKSFLALFNGRMKVEKQEVGTLVVLIFPK